MTCTHPLQRLALLAGLALAAVPLLCPPPAQAVPRQPAPPWPEFHLQHWSFDEALRQYPFNAAPSAIPEASLVESWSGYALRRVGERVTPFVLPEFAATNQVNFTTGTGAIRFWFKPDWGSPDTGDRGPGGYARLLEIVNLGTGHTAPTVQWSLYVTSDGSALFCSGQDQRGPRDYLRAPLQWAAETWHLVHLAYTATNSALYLDGELAAIGDPLPVPTAPTATELALVLGSDLAGASPAQGDFDELATFTRPPDAWNLTWYYHAAASRAALGPISQEELLALQAWREALQAAQAAAPNRALSSAEGGLGLLRLTQGVECANNQPPYLTNCFAAVADGTNWTFGFTIAGGTSGQVYDVLSSTLLGPSLATNTVWLTNAVPCEDYTFAHQPPLGAFYWLSLPGLGDTDDDGLPDWWETLHGLNPRVANTSGQDSDGDGLSDAQEYLYGSDPRSAPTWSLWVASPSTEGRLP
jgi:hypothetical protein